MVEMRTEIASPQKGIEDNDEMASPLEVCCCGDEDGEGADDWLEDADDDAVGLTMFEAAPEVEVGVATCANVELVTGP